MHEAQPLELRFGDGGRYVLHRADAAALGLRQESIKVRRRTSVSFQLRQRLGFSTLSAIAKEIAYGEFSPSPCFEIVLVRQQPTSTPVCIRFCPGLQLGGVSCSSSEQVSGSSLLCAPSLESAPTAMGQVMTVSLSYDVRESSAEKLEVLNRKGKTPWRIDPDQHAKNGPRN